jgi:hypothetical protein
MLQNVKMKKGDKHRTIEEVEADRKFAIDLYLQGYRIREIKEMLEQEHCIKNNPYKVSLMLIQRDIANTIKEGKILRSKAGVDDLEDAIKKAEYIYNECLRTQRVIPHPGYMNAANKALEMVNKLKGLGADKVDITIKYDVEI